MDFEKTRYQLVSSENFDEYMSAIGVPEEIRDSAKDPNAQTLFDKNGDDYLISVSGSGKTVDLKFKLGVEFDEITPHGAKVKTVVTLDGNKLVQKQKSDKGESVIIREFNGDEMTTILTAGNITSTRKYKKIE